MDPNLGPGPFRAQCALGLFGLLLFFRLSLNDAALLDGHQDSFGQATLPQTQVVHVILRHSLFLPKWGSPLFRGNLAKLRDSEYFRFVRDSEYFRVVQPHKATSGSHVMNGHSLP